METAKTVLVIDDDAHIRRVLEIKLKAKGYNVVIAKNGVLGLTRILEDKPRVVISDINMPKLNGRSLCIMTNELKRQDPFLTIVMTSNIALNNAEWIDELIDTIFLEKPFSPSKIVECVENYIKD